MPTSNLASYLAKNYLTASTSHSSDPNEPPKKKRKKASKHQSSPTAGLIIADDEDDLHLSHHNPDTSNDNDTPMMYDGAVRSAEFRKTKKSAWQPLPTATPEPTHNQEHPDEADTLLQTARSDEATRLALREAENQPTIVEDAGPRMESGLRTGLQTAADTAALVAAEEAAAARERPRAKKPKTVEPEEQTIYRDATGRRIDISARRAEARREEAERERAKKQERVDAMGDVQQREREERRRELGEAKFLTVGRGVDDEELNERLKGVTRWDDPMAAYMAEKNGDENPVGKSELERKAVARKKEYQGSAPPNRYGIKPGWRWDGVDRGNGFEKEWFQARSRRSRNEQLSYEWQMDE